MHSPARRFSILSVLLAAAVFVSASLAGGSAASAQSLYNQPKYAAIVVDATSGEVLYARRADQPRYPASISKVMTLYLVFEALATGRLSNNDPVVLSRHAANQAPSKSGLRAGESLTVDQALRIVTTKSANDIAVALAEKIGGTESRFAALMTLRAQELGMTNTRFVNASGLPDTRQISTARDIAILSRAIMRDYPQYYSYFGLKSTSFRGQTIVNHNRLLMKMPGVDGLKTGFINASGYNLAASAVRDGKRLIAVVLGGSSTASRDENVEDLLNAGFDVLAKRKMGQSITIAANMREPDDVAGPIVRPSVEQGSGEQDGLKVVVADADLRGPQAPSTPSAAAAASWLRPVTTTTEPSAAATAQRSTLKESAAALAQDEPAAKPIAPTRAQQQALNAAIAKCAPAKVKGKVTTAAKRKSEACIATAKKTAAAKLQTASTGKAAPAKAAAAKASDKGGYRIQVGAFASQKDARAHLTKITDKYGSVVAAASPEVQAAGKGAYRARFNGFSQAAAKQACATLSSKGLGCLVLSPG